MWVARLSLRSRSSSESSAPGSAGTSWPPSSASRRSRASSAISRAAGWIMGAGTSSRLARAWGRAAPGRQGGAEHPQGLRRGGPRAVFPGRPILPQDLDGPSNPTELVRVAACVRMVASDERAESLLDCILRGPDLAEPWRVDPHAFEPEDLEGGRNPLRLQVELAEGRR